MNSEEKVAKFLREENIALEKQWAEIINGFTREHPEYENKFKDVLPLLKVAFSTGWTAGCTFTIGKFNLELDRYGK